MCACVCKVGAGDDVNINSTCGGGESFRSYCMRWQFSSEHLLSNYRSVINYKKGKLIASCAAM